MMPIYKDKERNTYYFSFTKVINGVKYNKKGRGFETKHAAQVAEIELINDLEKNKISRLSVSSVFDEFVKNTKSNLKPSSLNRYAQFKKIYLKAISDKDIFKLTTNDIVVVKEEIKKPHNSNIYTNKMYAILRNFLKYSNIAYNVTSKLQLPIMETYQDYTVRQEQEKKEQYITTDDFNLAMSFFETSNDSDFYYYAIFQVLYWSGLRIGELAALTIDDYNGSYINVNKDYYRVNGKDYITTPKTQKSIRKVYLDTKTIKILDEYITRFNPTNILFKRDAKYLNQQKLRQVLANCINLANLNEKYDIHLHSLRHSHASNLRALGYDEFVIAARLGNTPKVSVQTYIHTTDEELKSLINKLNK